MGTGSKFYSKISTVKYWWFILESKLLKIRPIRMVLAFCWAFGMTTWSFLRYWKGILERMKLEMTFEQAKERSIRFELRRADEILEKYKNETYLTQRRIDKLDRELRT